MSNNAAHDRLVRAGKLWLSQQGCMVADTQASGLVYSLSGHKMRAGLKGKPDITATVPPHGRALAAEAKTGAGRLKPAQIAWRDAHVAAGGVYVEFRTLEELQAVALPLLQEAP